MASVFLSSLIHFPSFGERDIGGEEEERGGRIPPEREPLCDQDRLFLSLQMIDRGKEGEGESPKRGGKEKKGEQ